MLEVWPNDTIEDIKKKLQEAEGIPPEQQERIIFDGMQLTNPKQTLGDANIAKGDCLHVIVKRR